jgi:hypothetical protein
VSPLPSPDISPLAVERRAVERAADAPDTDAGGATNVLRRLIAEEIDR